MILDRLPQSHLYGGVGELFKKGFAYLNSFDPDTTDGRHDLQGDDLYALVQSFETTPPEQRIFESHRIYADIHYIQSGNEIIYYRESSLLTPRDAYDPSKDATYYHDADDYPLFLRAGDFVAFWPQDGHKPGCLWGAPVATRKVVLKVRLL